MKTVTITAREYAKKYGCTPEYVTRKLRSDIGLDGIISWRKSPGRTGGWMITVLISWYENDTDSLC